MSNSRTTNSLKNAFIGTSFQIITLIVSFICRTVFIKLLNADYLGINGLFSNILSILSFTELGIGSALIYNMYKPVADNDIRKVAAIQNLYRKAYWIIACLILFLGLCVLPFLSSIINGQPNIKENLSCIYILFLINTASSYVLSFRKSLFTAYQREYVNTIIERSLFIVLSILQLVYLYKTRDYYGYLAIHTAFVLLTNLIVHLYAGKKFPEIVALKKEKLSKTEFKKIFNDIYSIFFYKLGSVILHSTDNIIISKVINVTIVGICSNYTLIVTTVEALIAKGLNGIVASIGNLNASSSIENRKNVFGQLCVVIYWIYGFCAVELTLLLNELVLVWLGNDYTLSSIWVVAAMVSSFYFFGINFVASNFRITMGYFKDVKYVPFIASILNVILSICLAKKIGLIGVFIATSITRMITFGIADPFIVIKKGLHGTLLKYYAFQLYFIVLTVLSGVISYYLCNRFISDSFGGLILSTIVIAITVNCIFLFGTIWTSEFKSLKNRFIK